MELKGVLDTSLGNFLCIRDFEQTRFKDAIEIKDRLLDSLDVYYKLKPATNEEGD